MRPVLLALSLLVLAAPHALAACTQLGCAQTLDEDGDGTPDGVLGGTSTVTPFAPTVGFLVNRTTVLLLVEMFAEAPHDPEPPVEAPEPVVFGHVHLAHPAWRASGGSAGFDVTAYDHDGSKRTLVALDAWTEDADGDGRADGAHAAPTLP